MYIVPYLATIIEISKHAFAGLLLRDHSIRNKGRLSNPLLLVNFREEPGSHTLPTQKRPILARPQETSIHRLLLSIVEKRHSEQRPRQLIHQLRRHKGRKSGYLIVGASAYNLDEILTSEPFYPDRVFGHVVAGSTEDEGTFEVIGNEVGDEELVGVRDWLWRVLLNYDYIGAAASTYCAFSFAQRGTSECD